MSARVRPLLVATCRTKEVDNKKRIINVDLVYTIYYASIDWCEVTTKSNIDYDD